MGIESLAVWFGVLSMALGTALAIGLWYWGIRKPQFANRWLHALQFTLWSAVLLIGFKGGSYLLRPIFGLGPDPYLDFPKALIGGWIVAFPLLFPVGFWLGHRKSRSSSAKAMVGDEFGLELPLDETRSPVVQEKSVLGLSQFLLLWAICLAGTFVAFLVAESRDQIDGSAAWYAAFTIAAVVQGYAVIRTIRVLVSTTPHRSWHLAKLMLLWGALVAVWLVVRDTYYVEMVIGLGGGSAAVLMIALTWTWLRARERTS